MFCINCGKQLEEGSRFCPYCGSKVPETGAGAYPPPAAPAGGAPEQNPFAGQAGGAPEQNPFAGQGQPGPEPQPGGQNDPWAHGQSGPRPGGQNDSQNTYQNAPQGGYQQTAWGGGAAAQNQNHKGAGFDPWAVGGGQNRAAGTPGRDDPWGAGGGSAYSAAPAAAQPPRKKKHTLRNVILIVLGVLVLAVIGLYILGSTSAAAYEPVIESYLSYAQQGDTQRIKSLFQQDYYEDAYVQLYGDEGALYAADAWTDCYGRTVERYEVAGDDQEEDLLDLFNQVYGLGATDWRDVTVDVYYEGGRNSCMDFELVEIGGSWYLMEIW